MTTPCIWETTMLSEITKQSQFSHFPIQNDHHKAKNSPPEVSLLEIIWYFLRTSHPLYIFNIKKTNWNQISRPAHLWLTPSANHTLLSWGANFRVMSVIVYSLGVSNPYTCISSHLLIWALNEDSNQLAYLLPSVMQDSDSRIASEMTMFFAGIGIKKI